MAKKSKKRASPESAALASLRAKITMIGSLKEANKAMADATKAGKTAKLSKTCRAALKRARDSIDAAVKACTKTI